MKRFVLSMSVIVSFGFYVIWQKPGSLAGSLTTPAPVAVASTPKKVSKPKQVATVPPVPAPATNNPSPQPPPVIPPAPKKTGIYNDGEYVGSVADAYYGNVQVKAIITNGKLSDVLFLDYPQDRNNSIRINSRALPILRQEAITAQSANVDGVSGASTTSPAFSESLAYALNQARA
ncbi:MAG: FMN-binding protein [Candidatus Nomurabacteria bacterium]|nr:FMN-binding protein [Candidatus Nomurabacteria bacterium]